MKKMYLLLTATLGFVTAASAQRHPDVILDHFYEIASPGQTDATGGTANRITDGTHMLFDADGNYKVFLSFEVTNISTTDTVAVTDTLHILGPLTDIAGPGIAVDANGGKSPLVWSAAAPFALIPNTNPGGAWQTQVSMAVNVTDWCDSVWFTSAPGSPNPVDELVMGNNITCHDVILDGWMTGVENVKIGGNGLNVFPNPSNGDMKVMYNFGNNNSGVITIVDVTGKVVYTQQLDANLKGLQTIPVNVKGLANGLYSLRLATGNKVAVEKVYINN